MKLFKTPIIILCFIVLKANCQPFSKLNNVSFNTTIEINKKNELDINELKQYLSSFFLKANTIPNISCFWSKERDNVFRFPYSDLQTIIYNSKDYTPLILSIKEIEKDSYQIKSAWIKNNNDTLNLNYIFNFIVAKEDNKYVFKNIISSNIKYWKKNIVKSISYYSTEKIDRNKAIEFNDFNNKTAFYFNSKVLNFTYFKCKSVEELMKIRGYDFEYSMTLESQIGGETFTNENLIFSGNNSEINKHELVHLYTFAKFKNIHNLIDEGISTFLGGSQGLSYKDHLFKLKDHLNSNKINIYKELFFDNYIIDQKTSLWYTVGALLCDLCQKKYGQQTLFDLMNSGKKDIDIVVTIEKIFKIDRTELDSFIRKEISNYEFDRK